VRPGQEQTQAQGRPIASAVVSGDVNLSLLPQAAEFPEILIPTVITKVSLMAIPGRTEPQTSYRYDRPVLLSRKWSAFAPRRTVALRSSVLAEHHPKETLPQLQQDPYSIIWAPRLPRGDAGIPRRGPSQSRNWRSSIPSILRRGCRGQYPFVLRTGTGRELSPYLATEEAGHA